MMAMAMMIAAIPEKSAPTTKYGPKIVECHIGCTVMANTHDTTVCTLTAMGMTMTAITPMAMPRMRRWRGVPVHPSARIR